MEHEILKILFDDDVVRYIAERHHVSPEVLIKDFFSNETGNTFKLLNNEIEIIRGLKTKLLESGDFKVKTIIPFCTSHSSGIGSSDANLHSLVSETDWKPGKRFSSGTNKKEIENWVESLDLNIKEHNNDMDYSKFPLEDG